ncbi:unnamed protein product [Ectocarpus sp. 8 AP-2014]
MTIHPHSTLLLAVLMLVFLFSGAEPAACSSSGHVYMDVSTPDEAQELVCALNGTGGGVFYVSWRGRVAINETFFVPKGSSLIVTGASGASPGGGNALDVIDAEGTTTIFSVVGDGDPASSFPRTPAGDSRFRYGAPSLTLVNMVLTGGMHPFHPGRQDDGGGGAIRALGAGVSTYNCTFRNNSSTGLTNGGGAIYLGGSELRILGTTEFVSNSVYLFAGDGVSVPTGFGGAIRVNIGKVVVTGTATFSNNTALSGGAISSVKGEVRVEGNVSLAKNVAGRGGAISAMGGSLIVEGATFTSNTATEHGGAAFISNSHFHTDSISSCSFEGNHASSNGGALYVSGEGAVGVSSSLFRGNSAGMNGGAAFNTAQLDVFDVRFIANTAKGQGVAIYNTMTLRPFGAGASFEGNRISCAPGKYAYDKVGSTHGSDRHNGSGRYEVVCAGCEHADLGKHADLLGTSIPHFDIVDAATIPDCKKLPTGVHETPNDTTVATFKLKKGYYRPSITSETIRECYQEDACLGGTDPERYCATLYTGPYCAVCATDSAAGYAYSCHNCSGDSASTALGFGVAVLVVVMLVVAVIVSDLVRVVGDEAREEDGDRRKRRCLEAVFVSCHTAIVKAFPLTAVKTVVVVWQITTQFGSIARNIFPTQYDDFLSTIEPFNLDIGIFLSYSCFMAPDFYDRLLLATMGPFTVLAFLSATYFVAKKRNRNSELAVREVQHKHLSAAAFVAFFVYSSVSFTIFQTFACDTLDDVTYLRADYSLRCGTTKHLAFRAYAIAMLCVYPVGIPAVFSWWVARNRRELQRSDRRSVPHLKPLSNLWSAYRPSRYYYEIVECGRRVLHAGIAVFVLPGSLAQIAIALLLSVVFLLSSQTLSPFEKRADMWLYFWGNGVVVASIYAALMMEISNKETDAPSGFGFVLIAANVLMAVAVLMESHFSIKSWRAERSPTTVELVAPIAKRSPTTVQLVAPI